jgi:hypothetical protein
MRNFYVPMRGANWRDATRRTNLDYLTSHVYPTREHVALKDITKFQVQMLLNRLAAEGILVHGCLPCTRSDQSGLGGGY